MTSVLLPDLSSATRTYFRLRCREALRRLWLVVVMANTIAIVAAFSWADDRARHGISNEYIQEELKTLWGLVWTVLLALQFTLKISRTPMQPGELYRDIFCGLPLTGNNFFYCAQIDNLFGGRSLFFTSTFLLAAPSLYFLGSFPASLLALPSFVLAADLALNLAAAEIGKLGTKIRTLIVRLLNLILGVAFARFTFDIPWIDSNFDKIMNPLGHQLGSILLGEDFLLVVPFSIACWAIAYGCWRRLQNMTDTSTIGWGETYLEVVPVLPKSILEHNDRFAEMILRFSRSQLTWMAFAFIFLIELGLAPLAISKGNAHPYALLAFCTPILFHLLVPASWKLFCFKRPLPIPTWKIMAQTMKWPALFIAGSLFLKALAILTFSLFRALPSAKALSLLTPILLWVAPLTIYCVCLCMTAGILAYWLDQRGVFRWKFLSVVAVAILEIPFWIIQFKFIDVMWAYPIAGSIILLGLGAVLLQASVWLFDGIDFST